MSKKSWLGGTSESDKEAAERTDAERAQQQQDGQQQQDNPSSAGSQDPNTPSAPGSAPAVPVNILRDDRNPETDTGNVNPHNNAAAQVPSMIPLDRDPETAEERAREEERIRNPKTDKDRADALKRWGRDVRLRGNTTSADWEQFQVLTGERTAPPSAEDIARAERERNQGANESAQQSSAVSRSERT